MQPIVVDLQIICLDMQDPVRFVLAAGIGTLFLVSLIVLRIYLVNIDSPLDLDSNYILSTHDFIFAFYKE